MGADRVEQAIGVADDATIELCLPATAQSVMVARQALSGFADAMGWSEGFTDDLRLALSEACTNVVMHAYRAAPDPGQMLVRVLWEARRLLVSVTDSGSGMGIPASDGGGGLGIPLMRELSEEIDIRSAEGCTEVRMWFAPGEASAGG